MTQEHLQLIGFVDATLSIWILSQTTMVALVTYMMVVIVRRASPSSRVIVCALGLVCMSVLPTLALLQSRTWSWGQWLRSAKPATGDLSIETERRLEPESQAEIEPIEELQWWQHALIASSGLLTKVEDSSSIEADSKPIRASFDWLVAIVFCSFLVGLARLIVGHWQVDRLRRRARELVNSELHEELTAFTRLLGINKQISLCVSDSIGTPAVVGWMRPMLLVPANWTKWTKLERQAVIAHELAHVRRSDYLTTAMSQCALAVNFFHPLAHAIIARLRLNQELAADRLAAEILGGTQQYIEILAGLALRQPMIRTPGPAQAFLPPRRMFVRRLEMMNDNRFKPRGQSKLYAAFASLAVVSVTVFASGLRPFSVQAQELGARGATQDSLATNDLTQLIPPTLIEGVIEIDVPALLESPPVKKIMEGMGAQLEVFPFDPEALETALVLMPVPGDRPPMPQPLVVLRFKQDAEVKVSEEMEAESRKLDAKTIVIGGTAQLRDTIGVLPGDQFFSKLLQRHQNVPIRAAARLSWLRKTIQRESPPSGSPVWAFAPLWEKVDAASLGIELSDQVLMSATLETADPEEVSETVIASKTLAKNFLSQFSNAQPTKSNRDPMQAILIASATTQAMQVLNSVTIETTDASVEIDAKVDSSVYLAVNMMLPAIQQARKAAQRMQSMNNMKQMMLALHNYAAVHKGFPPAVIVDPESGVKRSWRVEILPYVEQAQLYDRYKKNEPWDSESNLKVLDEMPQVFALPGAEGTNETPYQAIVSEDGALTPKEDGGNRKFRDFTDGMSNTVVLVETKPFVPWTKPDDVGDVMAVTKVSLRPGESGFLAAIADGSVRFFSSSIDANVWKALLTKSGGEVVGQIP